MEKQSGQKRLWGSIPVLPQDAQSNDPEKGAHRAQAHGVQIVPPCGGKMMCGPSHSCAVKLPDAIIKEGNCTLVTVHVCWELSEADHMCGA